MANALVFCQTTILVIKSAIEIPPQLQISGNKTPNLKSRAKLSNR